MRHLLILSMMLFSMTLSMEAKAEATNWEMYDEIVTPNGSLITLPWIDL